MGARDEQMRLYFGGEANRSMHLDSGRAICERRIDGDDARSERMKARFVAVLRQDDRSKGYLAGRDFGGNRHVGALMLDRLERADRFAELLAHLRSEEHTSELQSLMRISYAVFCLNKTTTVII